MKWSGSVMFNSLQPHELYVACQAPPPMAFSRQEYCKIAHKWERYIYIYIYIYIYTHIWSLKGSVQFSRSVVSDALQPHGLQHTRPPCPSPTPGVYSNPCPSSWWCHLTISSSVVPFSSCLQSFQHQGLFQRIGSSHQVAKVLEFQLQHQSFLWTFRTDLL